MYKSEVEHQRYICHDQGDSDKNYFGELPAGMFHLPVMFTERFHAVRLCSGAGQNKSGRKQSIITTTKATIQLK